MRTLIIGLAIFSGGCCNSNEHSTVESKSRDVDLSSAPALSLDSSKLIGLWQADREATLSYEGNETADGERVEEGAFLFGVHFKRTIEFVEGNKYRTRGVLDVDADYKVISHEGQKLQIELRHIEPMFGEIVTRHVFVLVGDDLLAERDGIAKYWLVYRRVPPEEGGFEE